MKSFSIKRFVNVARWDLAVNRPFYIKMLMLIAACVLIPVLLKYISILLSGGVRFGHMGIEIPDNVSNMAKTIYTFSLIIYMVAMGFMFHNLRTRQGRINELTLPATNLERFLWHVVFVLVGPVLAYVVSVLIADLVHVILGWVLLGQHSFESLTLAVFDYDKRVDVALNGSPMDEIKYSFFFFVWIMYWNYVSTFALGNAWKYKHNIVFTLLCHIAFWLCSSMLIGLFFASVGGDWNGADAFFSYLESHKGLLRTLLIGFALIVFCSIWLLTYRLYCRAQITTKRNP